MAVDVGKIIEYEAGEMSEDDTIAFFQELVDSGMAWSLQGHYGRTAAMLIDAGLVIRRQRCEDGACGTGDDWPTTWA